MFVSCEINVFLQGGSKCFGVWLWKVFFYFFARKRLRILVYSNQGNFVNKSEDLGKHKRVKANETMFQRFGLLNVQTVLKSWLTVFFFHAYLGYVTPFELAFISIPW